MTSLQMFYASYILFTTSLWGDTCDTILYSGDRCGYYPAMSVCISEPYFTDAGNPYKSLSIYRGKILCPSHSEVNADLIEKNTKRKYFEVLSFDYRIQDHKLFFLTNLIGNRKNIPVTCKIEETLLFDLGDSCGVIRSVDEKRCDGGMSTQLVSKAMVDSDSLFTYKISFDRAFDTPHLTGIVFNKLFQVKSIFYDTRGFLVKTKRVEKCVQDTVLCFK